MSAIATVDDAQGLPALLNRYKGQIAKALPKHLTPERMIRVALTAYNTTPALQKCDVVSVASAIMEASQLGLEPDGVLGHAYLVPYGSKCQLIPGYKGLIELARRSGKVSTVNARVVREGDHFEYWYGLEPDLIHKPGVGSERPISHVYAYFRLRDDDETQFVVMDTAEIAKIRGQSKAANSGPWVTHWEEMAKKTVIRRLLKLAPLSAEVARAIALDERADVGLAVPTALELTPDPQPIHAQINPADLSPSTDKNRGHDKAFVGLTEDQRMDVQSAASSAGVALSAALKAMGYKSLDDVPATALEALMLEIAK